MARALVDDNQFCEVYIDTPLAVAEERDVKGLYRKARRGELVNFTGIDSPYEPPEQPEVHIDTTTNDPELAAQQIVDHLRVEGIIA
jgi:bifunctional enzyme CysN/CysC